MGLYKRPDSDIWWMNFSVHGKRFQRSTGTPDKKLAERIYAKVRTQIVEDKWFDVDRAKHHTFDELMLRYLQEVVSNKSPGTQGTNRIQIAHLRSFFGNITLDKLTPGLISEYKSKRLSDGVKLQTIRYELVLLSHAMNMAHREWQWISSNPMKFIKIPQQDNQIERWLTNDEEKSLLSFCDDWVRPIVLFTLNTGMRMNEMLKLKWPDVDLVRRTVTIMESKNRQKRTLPLNDIGVDILKSIINESKVLNVMGYIFTCNGMQITKQQLQYYFGKAVKKAKIAHLRFHDLRHTFATRLAQKGHDIYKIGKLLGHKDLKTTQRYAHHCPDSLRDGVDSLVRRRQEK